MGLFAALRVGTSALDSTTSAIQTVGTNIANANTDGYDRQRTIFQTQAPQSMTYGYLGTGVSVKSVQRQVDNFLEADLRQGRSTLQSDTTTSGALSQLEATLNSMSDSDLSTSLSNFFSAMEGVSNDPSDMASRSQAVQAGQTLADDIQGLAANVNSQRSDLNTGVKDSVDQINTLTGQIAALNIQILNAEKGDLNNQANDLRTDRDMALKSLSDLVNIRTYEQANGTINVSAGNDFMVLNDTSYALTTEDSVNQNVLVSNVFFKDSGVPLTITGGKLQGLIAARDTYLGQFSTDLNTFAQTLMTNFNQIHSGGIGTEGFGSVQSANAVTDTRAALTNAGLVFPPQNGSFNILVRNQVTGEVQTFNIKVDLNGLPTDTALTDTVGGNGLVQRINAAVSSVFPAITATAAADGHLEIASSDPNYTFAFGNDTSHVLSSLGINTFFSGTGATDIGINPTVTNDPGFLAAGTSFNSGDNTNAQALVNLQTQNLLNNNQATLGDFYAGVVSVLGVNASEFQSQTANQQSTVDFLNNEREQVSGVNIDEEVTNLMMLQRSYQGAAQFIAVVDKLLDTLINSV